jgi:hypothetical protein
METKIFFPGQQPNEKICMVFRQHWFFLASKLLVWGLLIVLFATIDYLDSTYFPFVLDPAYLPLIDVFKILLLMFISLGLFIGITLYYLNMHIVTDERIVDIEQKSLLHHTISELHLEQIQDVTAEVKGFAENVLDYGDVYIQTAGETQRFVFNKIPNPTKVTKMILDLYEQLPDHKKIHKL